MDIEASSAKLLGDSEPTLHPGQPSCWLELQSMSPTDVLDMAKGMAGHKWWQQWGKSTPALQYVSQRALAQTVSASCSEQAWSEYDFVHSRRRNRLAKNYASMLVRGHNLSRLKRRLKKVKYEAPIIAWLDSVLKP